jgi:hypothetical protein
MNCIRTILIGVSLLLFSGCGEDVDPSNEHSDKTISKVEIHNTDSVEIEEQDPHEPQAPKSIMQTFTDALQTALDKRDIENTYIEPNIDPYEYPDNDPYNDSNI